MKNLKQTLLVPWILMIVTIMVTSCQTPSAPVPVILPTGVVEQVHGYTGGFHYDSMWFLAKFHNASEYTITSVTIRIRLTDKKTEEESWHQLTLGPPGAIIPPGETVFLSGDVGVRRTKNQSFYWEVAEMLGYKE